jgi:hypothetical protein
MHWLGPMANFAWSAHASQHGVARSPRPRCARRLTHRRLGSGGIGVRSSLTASGSRGESTEQGCGGESSPRWPIVNEGIEAAVHGGVPLPAMASDGRRWLGEVLRHWWREGSEETATTRRKSKCGRSSAWRGKNGGGGFNSGNFDGAPVIRLGQEAAGRSIGGSGVVHLEEEM